MRSRWQAGYEEENRQKLYREKDGLMYIHRQLNFSYVETSRLMLGAPREKRSRKKTPSDKDLRMDAQQRMEEDLENETHML